MSTEEEEQEFYMTVSPEVLLRRLEPSTSRAVQCHLRHAWIEVNIC